MSHDHDAPPRPEPVLPPRPFGVLARFDTPDELIGAATKIRDAGFIRWDCHTPFPVHGLDGAMNVKPTRLPMIVFAFALIGATTGICLQFFANSIYVPGLPTFLQGYEYMISG